MKWSYSTHVTMRRCQRLLVFGHSMASHAARDPERREAYILKQLRPLSVWQGSLVHEVLATQFLADNIRAGRPVDAAALAATAHDLARRQFAFSAARRYRQPGQTKRAAGDEYCALFEHEYGREVPAEALAALHVTLARCFEHLASQVELLAMLQAGHQHEAEVSLTFRLGALRLPTATATLDLVFLRPNGQPAIIDWKVAGSETSDYARQLLVYALAVARCGRWPGAIPEAIELYEVNLLTNRVRQHPVSADRLDEAEDFVYRGLMELNALVGKRKFEELDLNDFEVAERPTTCFHCSFGPLCVRLLEETSRPVEAEAIQGRLW